MAGSLPTLLAESRRLGSLLGEIFTRVEPVLAVGTTTATIDAAVEAQLDALGVASLFRALDFPGCDFACDVQDDEWTAIARDGRRSVQFSQMVIVGDGPAEIVTTERPGLS